MEINQQSNLVAVARAAKVANDGYESLFKDGFIVLDNLNTFLDVCARFGCIEAYPFVNLLLIYAQCPNAVDIYPPEYMNKHLINVLPDQTPHKLILKNEQTKLYYVKPVYEASQTDAPAKPYVRTPTIDESYEALLMYLLYNKIEVYNVSSGAVRWKDWAKIHYDPNKNGYVCMLREPTFDEVKSLSEDDVSNLRFRDIVIGLAERYYRNPDVNVKYWKHNDGENPAFYGMCCLSADLVCSYCNIQNNRHFLKTVPVELNGGYVKLEAFENLIKSSLSFYRAFFGRNFLHILRQLQLPKMENNSFAKSIRDNKKTNI